MPDGLEHPLLNEMMIRLHDAVRGLDNAATRPDEPGEAQRWRRHLQRWADAAAWVLITELSDRITRQMGLAESAAAELEPVDLAQPHIRQWARHLSMGPDAPPIGSPAAEARDEWWLDQRR